MGIITEAELRDQIRQPQRGASLSVPAGTRFSPAAQDFLKQWQIDVRYDAEGPALSVAEGAGLTLGAGAEHARPLWDKPGSFPVVLEGHVPICMTCGQPITHKPNHMTQVDAGHYAPKNTPRVRFRGKLDTIHGLCLLVAARAQALNLRPLADHLATLAAYCREIMSAEYHGRPVAALELAGLDEQALHQATHDPKAAVGIDHIVPDLEDHEILHWLNYLRCEVREAEITALDLAAPTPGPPLPNAELAHAVNRLSSAVYYLELQFKGGKLGWTFSAP